MEEYDEGEIDKLREQNKQLLQRQKFGSEYQQKWTTIETDLYKNHVNPGSNKKFKKQTKQVKKN